MRRTHILLTIFLAAVFALTSAPSAHAQDNPKWEIFAGYTYMHSNIIVTNAGFNLNGGSGSLAYHLTDWFALVGELDVTHSGGVTGKPFTLTVYTYNFGPRVSWHNHTHLTPYGQVLFGGGHAGGSLYTSSLGAGLLPLGSSNDFNFTAGGGVDWKINHRFSVRLAQAEYLHTQFANAVNNSENNFRLSTGVIFTFGQK